MSPRAEWLDAKTTPAAVWNAADLVAEYGEDVVGDDDRPALVLGGTVAITGTPDELRDLVARIAAAVQPLGVTARFTPEAWVRDNAIEVDPRGDTEWDATAAFYALSDDYRAVLIAEMDDDQEALDCHDALRDDPQAPRWARNWSGPFSIHVRWTTG